MIKTRLRRPESLAIAREATKKALRVAAGVTVIVWVLWELAAVVSLVP
jgi:hypothetical protein